MYVFLHVRASLVAWAPVFSWRSTAIGVEADSGLGALGISPLPKQLRALRNGMVPIIIGSDTSRSDLGAVS